jgi:hypothetical protein
MTHIFLRDWNDVINEFMEAWVKYLSLLDVNGNQFFFQAGAHTS